MKKVETTFTKRISKWACQFAALALLGALAIGPALADKRGHDNRSERGQDNGRDKGHDNRSERGDDKRNQKYERRDDRDQARFSDRHRQYAREYYDNRKSRGRYRKEKNRRYEVGRRLPRDVIFYEVPRSVASEFGQPPRGYRYVRVSNDILLISAITGLVIDALRN